MSFKYDDEMRRIPHCPPDELVREERAAYRFVRDEVGESSFLPVAKLDPSRLHREPDNCALYGISLYDSLENANRKLKYVLTLSKNIRKRIGEQIASGKVDENSGAHTVPAKNGHFTLYEYSDSSITGDFSLCDLNAPEAVE